MLEISNHLQRGGTAMTAPIITGGLPAWAEKGTELPIQAQSSVTVRSWQDCAIDDAARFAADLQALGLSQDEADGGAKAVRSVTGDAVQDGQFATGDPGGDSYSRDNFRGDYLSDDDYTEGDYTDDNALARLSNWFAGRKIVVDSRQPAQVCLPLFVLSAYATPGCVSTYQTTTDRSRKLGWNVTVFGTGLSGEATVSSSVTSTLTADAGQAVLIFLPITVAVEQVRVVAKDGTTISSGQRIDVSPAQQEHPVPGGRLLDASALPAPGAFVQTYPLASYASASSAEYQYVYTQEKAASLQIGLKVSGADVSVTGSVSMSTSVTLGFKLVGGRDYRLCRLADGGGDGLVWG
jgi:hypothetical protein